MRAIHVIAGGELGDFALARHVQLSGTQRDLGHDIADFAWTNHHVAPQRSADPSMTRARRQWQRMHWPELESRATGVADRWDSP